MPNADTLIVLSRPRRRPRMHRYVRGDGGQYVAAALAARRQDPRAGGVAIQIVASVGAHDIVVYRRSLSWLVDEVDARIAARGEGDSR